MIATRYSGLIRLLWAALLIWAAGCGNALAGITVTAVTVNGSSSTVFVKPGTVVQVAVTVTLTNGTRWWSTAIYTSPTSSMNFCTTGPDVVYTGSRTFVFNVTAPSTMNLFSLVVAAHSNNNCTNGGERSTRSTPAAIDTRPVVVGVDHLQIEHDGNGRTCGPKAVTIKACANLACTTTYTASTTVSLTATNGGSWGPMPLTFTGGTTTANLSKTASGIVTMGGTVTSPAPKSATICVKSGVAGSCDVDFSARSCSLDAVEIGKAPATPIYTKTTDGVFRLDVLTLNGSGALANSSATITARLVDDASCVGTNPTLTFLSPEVSGTFSGNRLAYTFAPSRASRKARVRMVNGALIGCSSDQFAIRPARFTLSTVAPGAANADPLGGSATAVPVLKAGSTEFSLSATATAGYDGQPAHSSDRLAAADLGVDGVGNIVAGNAGTLDTNFTGGGFGLASAGVAVGKFKYSEVGYVKLLQYSVFDSGDFALVDSAKDDCFQGAVALNAGGAVDDPNVVNAAGKLGCYFGNVETQYFGRFIPNRFIAGDVGLTNRSAILACAASTFTYMGEEMQASVKLSAVNGADELTANYSTKFNRLSTPATQLGIGAINDAPVRTAFPLCGPSAVHPCVSAGAVGGDFMLGVATFTAPLTVFRPTVAAGPFEFFKVGVAPTDLDGVKLDALDYNVDTVTVPTASATMNRLLVGVTKARYGRLNIDNSYGSELLNLSMRVSAQYWNANGYATNLLDSCTPLPTGLTLDPAAYRGAINASNMPSSNVTAGAAMTNGAGRVVLKKPLTVLTSRGSAVLKSGSLILPGSGRATFGVYKAGPIIYVRETY